MSLKYSTLFFYFSCLFVLSWFRLGLAEISRIWTICTTFLYCLIISVGCSGVQIIGRGFVVRKRPSGRVLWVPWSGLWSGKRDSVLLNFSVLGVVVWQWV